MWEQVDYSFQGEHFTVPYAAQHPAQAVRQGSPADLGRLWQPADVQPCRRARHRRHRVQLRADLRAARPHRGLQGRHRQLHRPDRAVQERQRDDHQLGDLLRDPRGGARDRVAQGPRLPRVDGEPLPRHDAEVAGRDHVAEHAAVAARRRGRRRGRAARRPDRGRLHARAARPTRCREQIASWGDVGMDQLVFGLPIEGMHHEEVLACLELFGDKVIPEFDKDRTHSTDYYRADRASRSSARSRSRCPRTSSGRRIIPVSALAPARLSGPTSPHRAPRRHRHQGTAPPRGGAAVRDGAALYQVTVREIVGSGRAAQRLRAELPLRVARGGARRDPDPPRRSHRRRARRAARRDRAATPPSASSSPRSSCRTRPTSRRPTGATTCASWPSCRPLFSTWREPEPGTGPVPAARSSASSSSARRASAPRGPARAGGRDDHADDGGDGRAGPRRSSRATDARARRADLRRRTSPTCWSACSRRPCGERSSAGERG